MKEAGHLGWIRFTDPAHRIAVCQEELWLGKEKTNPVTVTGTRMGWLLNRIGLCQLGLGAAIGRIRVFEEVTAPIIEPQLAILARLHGQSAH